MTRLKIWRPGPLDDYAICSGKNGAGSRPRRLNTVKNPNTAGWTTLLPCQVEISLILKRLEKAFMSNALAVIPNATEPTVHENYEIYDFHSVSASCFNEPPLLRPAIDWRSST